jgi:hypothetical protein
MRSCGTVAKADGNGENKLRPVVTEGSYLLEHDIFTISPFATQSPPQGEGILGRVTKESIIEKICSFENLP